MPRYDIVFLDADNTLLDFDAAEAQALSHIITRLGYPEEAKARYIEINKALWAAMDRGEITQAALVVERFARLMQEFGGAEDPAALNRDYLDQLGRCSLLLPGALALCQTLRQGGCRLALATNGVSRVQRARMADSPLRPLLEEMLISEDLGAHKPDVAFFQQAFSALRVDDLSRVVMVGDSLSSDIQGGNNAGIDTIWYNPNGLPTPQQPVATHMVTRLEDIAPIILEFGEEENETP